MVLLFQAHSSGGGSGTLCFQVYWYARSQSKQQALSICTNSTLPPMLSLYKHHKFEAAAERALVMTVVAIAGPEYTNKRKKGNIRRTRKRFDSAITNHETECGVPRR